MYSRLCSAIKILSFTLFLVACGGGGEDSTQTPSIDTLDAIISFQGLDSEIEVFLNGEPLIRQSDDGEISLTGVPLKAGDSYSFTYESESNQFCRIESPTGTVVGSEVNVSVNCLTWTYPQSVSDDISPENTEASEPVVAMNENGDAVVAWVQSNGVNFGVFRSEYRNGAWTHPQGQTADISVFGGDASSPDVAINSSGDAIIVWAQFDGVSNKIYKSEYKNGNWADPEEFSDNLSQNGSNPASAPKVSMNNNGKAVVVWQQFDNVETHIFRSEDVGGFWLNSGQVDSATGAESAFAPEVAVSAGGDEIITWEQSDGSDYRIFRRHCISSSCSIEPLLDVKSPNALDLVGSRIAMNSNNEAIVVWQQSDETNTSTRIFKSEYKDGSWQDPQDEFDSISVAGSDAENPQVSLDDSGNATIVWEQSNGSNTQIFKSELSEGVWVHPSDLQDNISVDGSNATGPKVSVNNEGYKVIAWNQVDDGGGNLQVFKSEYYNGNWTHPSDLQDFVSPSDGQSTDNISLSINDNGEILMWWNQFDENLGSFGRRQVFGSEHRLGGSTMQPMLLSY